MVSNCRAFYSFREQTVLFKVRIWSSLSLESTLVLRVAGEMLMNSPNELATIFAMDLAVSFG
jgi:hypothetical protein